MKQVVENTPYGTVTVTESCLTGKKCVFVDGVALQFIGGKYYYKAEDGSSVPVTLSGSFMFGMKLFFGNECITVVPRIKWYELLLSLFPIIFALVWGNVKSLVLLVPLIGGAVGGLIGGLATAISLWAIRAVDKLYIKILISTAVLAATFALLYLGGYILLKIAAK